MPANLLNLRPSSDGLAVFGRPLRLELHRSHLTRSPARSFPLEGCLAGTVFGRHRLARAQEIDAVLISLDGDFADIINYPPKDFKGIIALQMRNHPEILPRLLARLKAYLEPQPAMEHYRGKLIVVEADRVRVRQ